MKGVGVLLTNNRVDRAFVFQENESSDGGPGGRGGDWRWGRLRRVGDVILQTRPKEVSPLTLRDRDAVERTVMPEGEVQPNSKSFLPFGDFLGFMTTLFFYSLDSIYLQYHSPTSPNVRSNVDGCHDACQSSWRQPN